MTTMPLFWTLFPFGFVAFWVLICFVISLSGWRTLARHFTATSKPVGDNFPMMGAEIGGARYNGCLSLVVSPDGLWLQPWLPFRAFHPPLLLPWSAFGASREEKMWGWKVKRWLVEVQTPNRQRVKIIFSPPLGPLIAERVTAARTASEATPWSDSKPNQ